MTLHAANVTYLTLIPHHTKFSGDVFQEAKLDLIVFNPLS